MKDKGISRRNFIQKTAVTAGMTTFGAIGGGISSAEAKSLETKKLPREVWIGSFSQSGFQAESSQQMVDQIIRHVEAKLHCQPDIICFPEYFPFSGVRAKYDIKEKTFESEKAMKKISAFSKKHNCYSVCPAMTSENGKIYNAAVIFDRKGEKVGEYRKAHPTEGEVEWGTTPGSVYPPVFKTDFGTIGVQICFDMSWDEGWAALREQGAEIVFFPSELAGGQMVNMKACMHKYVVVSSTTKMTSKICDITGEAVAQTGFWDPNFVCAQVNLEKAFLHLWPYYTKFDGIQKKYGRKVRITMYHEEEWAIIESLSHDVKLKDILKEYGLKTFEEHKKSAQIVQEKTRGK